MNKSLGRCIVTFSWINFIKVITNFSSESFQNGQHYKVLVHVQKHCRIQKNKYVFLTVSSLPRAMFIYISCSAYNAIAQIPEYMVIF